MDKLIRRFPGGERSLISTFPVLSAGYIYAKDYFFTCTFQTLNFVFVLSGTGRYYWKGKYLHVHAPCVLVQPPDVELRFGPKKGGTWDEVHFVLPPAWVDYVVKKGLWDGKTPVWQIKNIKEVLTAASRLKSLLNRPLCSINLDRLDYLCEQILVESVLEPEVKTSSRYYSVITEIYRDMERCNDFVDLEHYSKKYRISIPTIRRYWSKYMGVPPAKFRIEIMVRKACTLLTQTDLSIKEVAEKLDFADQFYFSRQFKIETGFSPSEYRQRCNA
jgi:AraC-like DNA-binding protein